MDKLCLANELAWELADRFRGKTMDQFSSVIAVYLVLRAKKREVEYEQFDIRFETMVIGDELIKNFIERHAHVITDEIIYIVFNYDIEVLTTYLQNIANGMFLRNAEANVTPESIVRLAIKVLNIVPGNSVCDMCSGMGAFLVHAAKLYPEAKFFGNEIMEDNIAISRICADALDLHISISMSNVLKEDQKERKYDKIFSNFPMGTTIRDIFDQETLFKLSLKYLKLNKSISADWLFNNKICERLEENGTGVAISSLGSLVNTTDKYMREEIINKNMICAVVKLPAKLFPYTSIQCAMVIFGKNKSEKITFVDASKEFKAGRRQNYLSEKNIECIADAISEESNISRSVGYDDIAKKDYLLDPSRYFVKEEFIKNGKALSDIATSITRGAPCTAAELDDITSLVPTNNQYLMLANIKGGIIDAQLPYLKEIPAKYKKYCIKPGDILLSKNGYPFKVAVAEPPFGREVLANGNLYIISLNENLVDPYYVKAFLESEQGSTQLKNIAVGTAMPNIGIAQLGTIMIPVPPMSEQKQLVEKYKAVLDKISNLRSQISEAENDLKKFFTQQ